MKRLIFFALMASGLTHARVVEELSFSMGYHGKETYSLKHYQTRKNPKGYAFIKLLKGNRARYEILNEKDYRKKISSMRQIQRVLQKHEFSPGLPCLEDFRITQKNDRKPASVRIYCLDHLAKKEKTKISRWWKTGRFK